MDQAHHPSASTPIALITGASSGIGECLARALAAAGYRTLLIARRITLLEQLAAQLRAQHGHASTPIPLDLANSDSIAPALSAAFTSHGSPSVVMNCAGFGTYAPFMQQPPGLLARIMAVNHEAPIHIIRSTLPGLLDLAAAGQTAHVFNICSSSARIGAWGHAGYAASKGAMRTITEVLASEFAPRGVRFTVVYPGIIATPYFQHPGMNQLWPKVKHRAITPERVARAVVARIGRSTLSMYIPAHYRLIDLLATVSPRLALNVVQSQSRAEH